MSAGPGRAMGQWAVALGLMVVSGLTYQPSALFYVVPLGRRIDCIDVSEPWRNLRGVGSGSIWDSWLALLA